MKETDDIPYLRRKLQSLIQQEKYERCSQINKWIKDLEKNTLDNQLEYVKKVVSSCKTNEQRLISHEWAFRWAQRMRSNFPSLVTDTDELFKKAIEANKTKKR
ncbi:MAG: hypothetical protein CMP57_03995 [Flavobacteriales bacterium]|nr:hypothetical protein [Flavobacteriales bacterium]|tara:strand:+ start:310 stop:618 length:309 start_codon:yes stop_codon:yes gene_type:complete